MRLFKYISTAALLLALAFVLDSRRIAAPHLLSGKVFGTYYHVKIAGQAPSPDLEKRIEQVFDDVNRHLSVFTPESEINRLNRAAIGEKFNLSPDLALLLKTSAEINRQSDGYFDPTVAPLVNLWGFGPRGKVEKIPDPKQIDAVLSTVGFHQLHFAPDFRSVVKKNQQTSLNLSAIAKGYAVDKIASLLENDGIRNYIVEIGGEIKAAGEKSPGKSWTVGVAFPSADVSGNILALQLKDMAVATSGDYHNFFNWNGKRYAHTISPFDGRPIEHNLASATVLAPDCMTADAYATAIMALGEDRGLALAEKLNLPVILFVREADDSIKSVYSSAAASYMGEQQ